MYAYWPDCHSSMIRHKVKKREIPDKENWKRYEVKIFSYTGNILVKGYSIVKIE